MLVGFAFSSLLFINFTGIVYEEHKDTQNQMKDIMQKVSKLEDDNQTKTLRIQN